MSTPYLGELRVFSFGFAPKGWAQCNGQLLPINQNQALYSLLGTIYGGNGQTNFALPNLQGRVPFHVGGGLVQGQSAGEEFHTLVVREVPAHTHVPVGSSAGGSQGDPTGAYWADGGKQAYAATSDGSVMAAAAIGTTGGSQAHENRSPFLTLNICIALQGIYPSRS